MAVGIPNGTLSFFVVLTLFGVTTSRKLPSYVQTCKKNDPNFDKCLLESVEAIRPYLPKGIPKIRVPPIEPLYIPKLDINRDLENLKVRASLKEIRVYGASNYVVKKLKANVDKLSVDCIVTIPHLYITAEYDVDGRLLLVPLKGKGFFKGNLTDTTADVKSTADIATNSKGVKHLVIKAITTKLRVGDQNVQFLNKDTDANNALITQTAATFINQNRRQVLDIVTPIAEETVVAFIQQIGNNILKSIPYSEILPE